MAGKLVQVVGKEWLLRNERQTRLKDVLHEYPFGPSNLYSTSNLDTFSFKSDPQTVFSLHADHSQFVKLNKIVPSADTDESKLFERHLDRSKEIKISEEKFSTFSRVYGFATSKLHDLIALKYWEGIFV